LALTRPRLLTAVTLCLLCTGCFELADAIGELVLLGVQLALLLIVALSVTLGAVAFLVWRDRAAQPKPWMGYVLLASLSLVAVVPPLFSWLVFRSGSGALPPPFSVPHRAWPWLFGAAVPSLVLLLVVARARPATQLSVWVRALAAMLALVLGASLATVTFFGGAPFAQRELKALAIANGLGCALSDGGELACWESWSDPPAAERSVAQIVASHAHVCLRYESGSVACFVLGIPPSPGKAAGFEKITLDADTTSIGVGLRALCGAKRSGGADCTDLPSRESPSTSPAGKTRIFGSTPLLDVGVGADFACSRMADRTPSCAALVPNAKLPVLPARAASALTVGDTFACALYDRGGVICDGSTLSGKFWPAATAIAAGGQHVCALLPGGAVECSGANDHGQLGRGVLRGAPGPAPVGPLDAATTLWAFGDRTCTRSASNAIFCWGANAGNELRTAERGQAGGNVRCGSELLLLTVYCAATPTKLGWP
jgi:hypothetical protein